MKTKFNSNAILTILFGYIILQFLWWEVLLVRQNGKLIEEKQKILELTSISESKLRKDIIDLHTKKTKQTWMIVGEGTVFLLLLLYGINQIKLARKKENELNKHQENFFLSITHELKTPIAATKLQLQTMQKQQLTVEQQQELIKGALVETERLNQLIDNVLMAGRLDSGQLNFEKEKTDLSKLVKDLLNRYYKDALQNGTLTYDIESGLMVKIDSHYFPSIITNLIDNAFKYSSNSPNVKVELKKSSNNVLLSIQDNGIGITLEERDLIFKKFIRSGNEETRKTKGTGLGLYIVKYLVNQHNAKINVKQNQPKGSIFEIEFNAA